jgi:Xaa-Pro aminopeptidase
MLSVFRYRWLFLLLFLPLVAQESPKKEPRRIRYIRRATQVTCKAHIEAMRRFKLGMRERDLEKIILKSFKKHKCRRPAFPPIIAAGRNAIRDLHHRPTRKRIKRPTLIVIDIGCKYKGWCSDVTRTIPSTGKFTKKQRKAYQVVLEALKAAEAKLKPGVTWARLNRAARKVFRKRKYTRGAYYRGIHGLGHGVGRRVHAPTHNPLRKGDILTLEPGLYNPRLKFGIRIEDMYLITKDGYERLSSGAPREIEEIEKIMAEEERTEEEKK